MKPLHPEMFRALYGEALSKENARAILDCVLDREPKEPSRTEDGADALIWLTPVCKRGCRHVLLSAALVSLLRTLYRHSKKASW